MAHPGYGGIDRVDENAAREWKRCAWLAAQAVAARMPYFDAEDVWEQLRTDHPHVATHNNMAMGPVMLKLKREGLAVKTSTWRPCRNGRGARDVLVWRAAWASPFISPEIETMIEKLYEVDHLLVEEYLPQIERRLGELYG